MSQSKERVLAVYPGATCWVRGEDEFFTVHSAGLKEPVNRIGGGSTAAEAWDDAASKLPHPEPPRQEQEVTEADDAYGPTCPIDGESLEEHCDTDINAASVHREYWFQCPKCGAVYDTDNPDVRPKESEPPSPAGEIASEVGIDEILEAMYVPLVKDAVPSPVSPEGAAEPTCYCDCTRCSLAGSVWAAHCNTCIAYGKMREPSAQPSPEAAAASGTILGTWPGNETDAELLGKLSEIRNPAAPIAAAAQDDLITAVQLLVDAMETCHICKVQLITPDGPTYCEDCSSDCARHEGEECTPVGALHQRVKDALIQYRKGVCRG